ncbi:hypothetical protein GJU39_11020 [Pedobacter petrophilus]|uniref:Uncharacterized protein n=1 Tax=Pedobacter petrophilus TaxID=1908241 RepID=A0A7K0FYF3_9SPHI|nr:hypothetical protein [Pedobacter petrophilus]MRX76623.1 hypothetical protein [Pedobacter petrophilus]
MTPKNLIHIITFNVRATRTIGDDGIIPWINIGRGNEEILNLIDADEIVITEHALAISLDYPLAEPVTFQLFSSIGFSRKLLLVEIREKFLEILKQQDVNFDLSTLDLVALDVYKTESGSVELTLDIDL